MITWSWDHASFVLPTLLEGLWVTLQATVIASAVALSAGLPLAIARTSNVHPLQVAVSSAVQFIRGTPLLLQLYFLYYMLPEFGIAFGALTTGIVGLSVHYTAYMVESYRAGIQSLPKGQWDACTVLGLPHWRTWLAVVVPQALVPTLPVLGGYVLMMFKESAILSAITVQELVFEAKLIGGHYYRFLEPFGLMALLYLALSYPAAMMVRTLERRIGNSKRMIA